MVKAQTADQCLDFEVTFNATGWNSSIMGSTMEIGCAGDYGSAGCVGDIAPIRPDQTARLNNCTCEDYGDPRFGKRGCLVIGTNLRMDDYFVGGIRRRRVERALNPRLLPSYCTLRVKGNTYDYRSTEFFPTAAQYDANDQVTFCGINGMNRDKQFSIICTPPVTNTPTPTPTPILPTSTPTPTPILPTSTPTPVPPTPTPIRYTIAGGIFIDDDNDGTQETTDGNGRQDTGENFTPGRLHITGPSYSSDINTSGAFTTSPLLAGRYTITYPVADIPPGYVPTYPLNSPPPTAIVTIGSTCSTDPSTGGHLYAACNLGNVTGLTFGIKPVSQPDWIQSIGGDIRWDGSTFNNIVPTDTTNVCAADQTRPFVSSNSLAPGTSLSDGIVFTDNLPRFILPPGTDNRSKANPSQRLVSDNKFTPGRPGTIKTSYAYVKAAINKARPDNAFTMFGGAATRACNELSPANCNLKKPLPHGIYLTDPNQTVVLKGTGSPASYTFDGGNDYMFVIDGNLRIDANMDVPTDSTAIFIVKGDIIVSSGVTRIEGIFSTDRTFKVEAPTTGTHSPLTIEGNVIANAGLSGGSFDNDRDLGPADLNCPAVRIINRPDFVLNGPEIFRFSNFFVQEVAPRGR